MLRFTVEKNHPSLSGHFPGNPIVPGVIILQYVFAMFNTIYPGLFIQEILNVKFRSPLSIQVENEVTFKENSAKQFQFQVKQNDKLITSGSLIAESAS